MSKRIEIYNMDHLRELAKEHTLTAIGEVWIDHKRNGEYLCKDQYMGHNLIPTEGLNALLDIGVGATAKETAWYCGIFKGSAYTPGATNTAATTLGVGGLATECQDADYTPATNRPAYTIVAASGGVITNTASKAEFTIAASINVYGAFIASSQAKTATTGKLLAVKKFDAYRAVIATDVLSVVYQISMVSA